MSLKLFFGLRLCHSWDMDCGLRSETGKTNVFARETDTERAKVFLEELLENLSDSSAPGGAAKELAVEQ